VTNTTFGAAQTEIAELGLNCEVERTTERCAQHLMIDTENATDSLAIK
jgi:hypothetical protein